MSKRNLDPMNVETVETFNVQCPIGTWVAVKRADGSVLETKTRSPAWVLGDGTPVVMVAGISGGYLLDRVTPNLGCDCGGPATGAFSVQHRRGCIIPGPHNDRIAP